MTREAIAIILLTAAGTLPGCDPQFDQPARAPSQPAQPTAPPLVSISDDRLIDLTHTFDHTTIYWPTAAPFRLEVVAEGDTDAGYYYSANQFCAAEHGGTHIDAPIHFARRRNTVDKIPLSQLMGEAVVVDVTEACAANRDYEATVADMERHEREHGRIPDHAIVLMRTGFGRYWPDAAKYMGTAERGEAAARMLHFPGLHYETADWLIKQRKVKMIGIDTPSIDHGQSRMFRCHVLMFMASVPAIENVANLDKLPAKGFTVIALPMKIGRGSGAPSRVVAVLP